MDDRAGAFKTHTGIDVFGGQFAETTIGLSVVLDKDEVPDFDAEIGVVVDEIAPRFRITFGREIDMQFRARTAGAGLTHHPEVVLDVAIDDLHSGVTAF